ncbi:25066_t:CDS:2, partial [Racocetra persica]
RKIIELQDQGLGKIDQSKGLTAEEICQIILYLEYDAQTALKLTWKAFSWNTYLLEFHTDQLNNKFKLIQDLCNYVNLCPSDICEYFYLQLTRNTQEINNGNWFGKERLEKNTLNNMIKKIAHISGINITNQIITNHSGRKTAIQLLSDLNINEHEM